MCCRLLESVDGKVSALRRELEEKQPAGHSHDIVDRSSEHIVWLCWQASRREGEWD